MACKALAADPNLAGGFNSIGVSQVKTFLDKVNLVRPAGADCVRRDPIQGAILMRGYLERCNQPKIKNFISWVSPQMGVYGVPNVCGALHCYHTHAPIYRQRTTARHRNSALMCSNTLRVIIVGQLGVPQRHPG